MLKEYALFILLFILFDCVYIYVLKDTHLSTIQTVQKSKPEIRYLYAILFYLLVGIGYIQIIKPLGGTNLHKLVFYSLLLGCLMYATFDLTSVAIFKRFPIKYAMMDIMWGSLNMMLCTILVQKLL